MALHSLISFNVGGGCSIPRIIQCRWWVLHFLVSSDISSGCSIPSWRVGGGCSIPLWRVGGGFPILSCCLTCGGWDHCAFISFETSGRARHTSVSFDTLVFSSHPHVIRQVGIGLLVPACHLTWRWFLLHNPMAFNMRALGFLHRLTWQCWIVAPLCHPRCWGYALVMFVRDERPVLVPSTI